MTKYVFVTCKLKDDTHACMPYVMEIENNADANLHAKANLYSKRMVKFDDRKHIIKIRDIQGTPKKKKNE